MKKQAILTLMHGSFEEGFPVMLRIKENTEQKVQGISELPTAPNSLQLLGKLPANPSVLQSFTQWQLAYRQVVMPYSRIKPFSKQVTNVSSHQLGLQLIESLNNWLNSGDSKWQKIREQLQRHFSELDEFLVFVETDDMRLRQLPWHLWDLFSKHYTKAEIVLSTSEYQPLRDKKLPVTNQVRILAILGNSTDIDVQKDRAVLEQLPNSRTTFLTEPPRHELNNQLWEQQWEILFFAGHSSSQVDGNTGQIYINQTDSLSLTELKNGLRRAISRGLQLAIFNSCDGLGLARELADLNIPQIVVMRQPVPDLVAQEFLKHFLYEFSHGNSLYTAVRSARERLQGLEGKYRYASWLPVICQNPETLAPTWKQLGGNEQDSEQDSEQHSGTGRPEQQKPQPLPRKRRFRFLGAAMLTSAAVTASVIGVRYLGMLQQWELQAFDQLVRARPDEKRDPRILIVTITENDIKAQDPAWIKGSISDWALKKLLTILSQNQARVIGLDLYRDRPAQRKDLVESLSSERLVGVCKVRDVSTGDPGIKPPEGVTEERLGFSDFIEDPDRIVRRHILYMSPDPASPCTAPYAFTVQLAVRYLAAEEIYPSATPEGFFKLGSITFKPLEAHTGGYQQTDPSSGHQILLNYRSPRSPENIAPQVSLFQVLRGEFDPEWVRDRIVLIGNTANSFGDLWATPYSGDQKFVSLVPGVLVQAQMLSQILSAVKDQRPMLFVWPFWGEALWIWGWSLVGGIFAWGLRSPLWLLVAGTTSVVVLYALCFMLLLQGAWVPLIPSVLALIITGGGVVAYTSRFQGIPRTQGENYDVDLPAKKT